MLKIGIMLGDDIGLEVVPECVKVMKAAAARTGLEIDWTPLPLGKAGHEEHGNTLPAITEKTLHTLDGWIMGPIGHAAYPRNDATWVMPPIRKKYELFTALRPSRLPRTRIVPPLSSGSMPWYTAFSRSGCRMRAGTAASIGSSSTCQSTCSLSPRRSRSTRS